MKRLSGRMALRWLLWGLTCLLVLALLAVMVFLVREYEENQNLVRLEQSAASMGMDVRSGLTRSVQNLMALHSLTSSPSNWPTLAADLLAAQRELVHLEWRDARMRPQATRTTPFLPQLYRYRPRSDSQADVAQACLNANRLSAPAYSPSYFWPLGPGQGIELLEMCLPLSRDGQPDGYLIATYSLAGLLTELMQARSGGANPDDEWNCRPAGALCRRSRRGATSRPGSRASGGRHPAFLGPGEWLLR
jgi:two-component system sensor histidine kinase DctS